MNKPRIFLGSSGKQQKILQALARGLEDVAQVERPPVSEILERSGEGEE